MNGDPPEAAEGHGFDQELSQHVAVLGPERLADPDLAGPLGHRDHVFFFGEDGTTEILAASAKTAQVVATNHLSVSAPVTAIAAVDDAILIRAGTELIRVSSDDKALN